MTTLTKPDGSETMSIQETMEVLLDYIFEEDNVEKNTHQKTIRKAVEEPMKTSNDVKFSREEIKQVIESFDDEKARGIDRITAGIYLRTFNILQRLVTAIYNQCLKRGCFPKRWKIAKIIPITKSGKENSTDPAKYRPSQLT